MVQNMKKKGKKKDNRQKSSTSKKSFFYKYKRNKYTDEHGKETRTDNVNSGKCSIILEQRSKTKKNGKRPESDVTANHSVNKPQSIRNIDLEESQAKKVDQQGTCN